MSVQTRQARRRRYLIDGASQLKVATTITAVLLLVGLLDALAVFVLADPSLSGTERLADVQPILLVVHSICLALGGIFLFWIVVKQTHRYVGPAYVMRRALDGMRKGEYGCRLSLRTSDYHVELAQALDELRTEIASRDVDNARTLSRLERGIEENDVYAIRDALRALGSALPALPQRRHDDPLRQSA
jgi:hypothetical protein